MCGLSFSKRQTRIHSPRLQCALQAADSLGLLDDLVLQVPGLIKVARLEIGHGLVAQLLLAGAVLCRERRNRGQAG